MDRNPPRHALRVGQRQRSTVFALIVCLLLATGLALLAAGSAVTHAGVGWPSVSKPAEANAELVRDFYGAVNDAIRTGDTNAFNAIVAPEFVWCRPCPSHEPTRDGLKRYLVDLHRNVPDAQLSVDSVVAGFQNTVTARIRISGYPMVGKPLPWGPVDTLHLAGGLIVERRSESDGIALVEPLLGAQLASLPPAVTGLTLVRLTFPPDSGVAGLLSAGPTLVVVEAGTLAVSIASGGRVLRADGDETTATSGETHSAVLRQGDSAIVPPGVRHALYQTGTEPAVAVGATLFFTRGDLDHPAELGPEIAPFFPPGWSIPESAPLLPIVHHLAGGSVDAWPTGSVRIAIGRAVLAPGARIVPPAAETLLLAVEAGRLGTSGGEAPAIGAGGGTVLAAGLAHEIRNAGDGLLDLVVLTIAPVSR